jgi:hypothetical protein
MRDILACVLFVYLVTGRGFAADFPKFDAQELDTTLKIGYAVLVEDINNDKKPDIVVVDQHRVVWYQNPGAAGAEWKKRVVLDGKDRTKPDHVCAAAVDIDGDGLPELVLGAGWRPTDTANPGTLQWLKRSKSLDDEWALYPIPCQEPTVHRVRIADLDNDGRPELIMAPLHGRDCTAKGNWTDGRPVNIVRYVIPKTEPEKPENWKPEVISNQLYVVHNIFTGRMDEVVGVAAYDYLYAASYEGVTDLSPGKRPEPRRVGEGNQSNPKGSRGASELFMGRGALATIEPWHGNQVVTYRFKELGKPFERLVIDDHLRWGHAVKMADLDGDRWDEIIVGVRDDPNPKLGDTFTERRGVRIYKNTHERPEVGQKWERFILEDGGVAVEDLAVADLNSDGKVDIVAVGRQTFNLRVYWNRGK